jgi:hypothetical protein
VDESRKFDRADECRAEIAARLAIPAGRLGDAILDALTDVCEVSGEPAGRPFGLRVGRWIIRDEDLKLFQSVRDCFVALAAVDYLARSVTAGTITAILFAIASLAVNMRRRGTVLDASQLAVVTLMKAAGTPLSVDEIVAGIRLAPAPPERDLSSSEVKVVLASLRALLTKDGTVAVVEPYGSERWILRGV